MIMRFLRRSVFIVLAAVLLVGEGLADSDSEKVVARLTEVNNRIISGSGGIESERRFGCPRGLIADTNGGLIVDGLQ